MILSEEDEFIIMHLAENILLSQIVWEDEYANKTEEFILDLHDRIIERDKKRK